MTPADRLAQLERVNRERGYTLAMVKEACELAAELEVDPPVWAAPPKRTSPPSVELPGPSWHERRREEQLKREYERWRYQRSKLPPEKRGRMMEIGQRECKYKYCAKFFKPATLRQRYCSDTCRKLGHEDLKKKKKKKKKKKRGARDRG